MDEKALAAAFDMEGGFNDVVLALSPGASSEEVIARLDRILEPYGGRRHSARASAVALDGENELAQLQSFGFLLPLIFLIVAAFILNVALTRALALQRPQIASLKALGYGNVAIGWHYLKWGFVIGAVGIAIGVVARRIVRDDGHRPLQRFLPFPELQFGVPPRVVVGAAMLTFFAAGAGAFGAVLRAVRIPPAEAMRPEVPARYRRTLLETPLVSRYLGTAGRMVLRNIARHPFRAAASVFGISFAVAILMIGLVFNDVIDRLIQTQFCQAERQDVTVNFVEPRSSAARYALAVCPESSRSNRSARRRSRPRRTSRAIPRHHRGTADAAFQTHRRSERRTDSPSPGRGRAFANAGQRARGHDRRHVTMEVLEGHRPIRQVEVTGLVDDLLGLSAYMDIDALHQMMQEGDVATGALMLVDAAQEAELSTTLKETPTVAGTGFKRSVLRRFREVLAANLGLSIFINLVFASVIAFGVVYNAARISLSERSRELASLRVLGFTRAEISLILMGELALLTLVSLPVGGVFGYSLAAGIVGSIDSEVYRFPLYVSRQAVAWSFLGIIGAALVSGLIVRRKLDALDLVAVLKIRE